MAKHAILICGFQNWGKSWTIEQMFGGQQRFWRGKVYQIVGVPTLEFLVESRSNDDFGYEGYLNAIKERVAECPNGGKNIITAFCPSREEWNNSEELISELYKGYQVHILCLEYKWDGHAKLLIPEIEQFYSSLRSVRVVRIGNKNATTRFNDVIKEIRGIYGV